MTGLLLENERFGNLVVVAPVNATEDEDQKYRVRCLKCNSDCVTATEDALLSRRVRECWDCRQFAKMTDEQRAALAFRKTLDLSPERILDHVDALPTTSSPLSIAQAIAA